ncbi:MAG TPA: hypothetical protein V6D25_17420 [Leptolyngbyaceae cyanobacterium]
MAKLWDFSQKYLRGQNLPLDADSGIRILPLTVSIEGRLLPTSCPVAFMPRVVVLYGKRVYYSLCLAAISYHVWRFRIRYIAVLSFTTPLALRVGKDSTIV